MATCDPDQACGLIVTGFRNIHTSEEGCLRRLCTLSAAVCVCVQNVQSLLGGMEGLRGEVGQSAHADDAHMLRPPQGHGALQRGTTQETQDGKLTSPQLSTL